MFKYLIDYLTILKNIDNLSFNLTKYFSSREHQSFEQPKIKVIGIDFDYAF